MQAELFDCSICCNAYNRHENIPKILPTCGHTVCSSCLDQILGGKQPSLCPLDRAIISHEKASSKTFPTNLFVLQMLDEQLKMTANFCPTHRETKTLMCMDDIKAICKFCVEIGEHKGHRIIHIDEVKTKAGQKKSELETQLNRFKGEDYDQILLELNRQQNDLKRMVMKHSEQLKEMILNNKGKVMAEINVYFENEKQKINAQLQKDLHIKERLLTKVRTLESSNIDENFFQAMAYEEKEDFSGCPDHLFRAETAKKNLEQFELAFKDIEKIALTLVEKFEALPLLVESVVKEDAILATTQDFLKLTLEDNYLKMSCKDNSQMSQVSLVDTDWHKNSNVHLELSDVKITQDMLESWKFLWVNQAEIKDLKLNLSNNPVSDKDFSSLWLPLLAKVKSPEAIEINLRRCRVTDAGVSQFFSHLKDQINLSKTKKFCLWLSNTLVSPKTIKQLYEHVLPLLISLENFQLYLGGTDLSDVCVGELVSSFKRNLTPRIHTFALFLSDTKITDYSLQSLAASLPVMRNLKDFQLGIYNTKTSDSGLERVLSSLSGMSSNLQTLSLYLANTKVSDSSMKVLAKEIMPNIKTLENFTLDLSSSQVSDSGLSKLFNGMDLKINSLKHLTLYFAALKIGDKSIEALAKNVLPRLTHLQDFTLNLSETKIKDSGLVELFNNMGIVMESLRSFVLSLSGTKVSDITIHALNKQLYAISGGSLEKLRLLLEKTFVTDGGIEEFCQIISKYRNPEKPLRHFEVVLNMTTIKRETRMLIEQTKQKLLQSI